jgi:hypothetical protein
MDFSGQPQAPAALSPEMSMQLGWLGVRAGLGAKGKVKRPLPCRESNPGCPVQAESAIIIRSKMGKTPIQFGPLDGMVPIIGPSEGRRTGFFFFFFLSSLGA